MNDTKDFRSPQKLNFCRTILILLFVCIFLSSCSVFPPRDKNPLPGTGNQPGDTDDPNHIPDPNPDNRPSVELQDYIPELFGGSWTAAVNEYLPLQEKPSAKSKELGRILKGEMVELIAYENLFAKVKYKGMEGYVMSAYLVPANDQSHNKELQIIKPVETYRYEQMIADLQRLAAAFPTKMTISSIGKSELGKDIPVAVLGNPSANHHILVHGAMHGREHMTTTLIMSQMEYLLSHENVLFLNGSIKDALSDVCFHLIPMVNPDGVEISQRGELPDSLVKVYEQDLGQKNTNLPVTEYARQWKANGKGVDLNRNFAAGWEAIAGIEKPSSERFKGQTPSDQSESAALVDYTLSHPFDATISYHSNGSIIYYEYGNREPVNSLSLSLGTAVGSVTEYPLINSQSVEGGGYKDWAMDSLGIPSLTIEIGYRPSPLVLDEFSSIYERNKYVLPVTALWVKGKIK